MVFFLCRNVECLNLLLSSGTDLNKRDIMGRWVPWVSECHVLRTSCKKEFKTKSCFSSCRTPLHYAAANGRYQCTVTLVSAGAEVNEPDQTGCTPLHYSAASQAFSRLETHYFSSSETTELAEAVKFRPSLRKKNDWQTWHMALARLCYAILEGLFGFCDVKVWALVTDWPACNVLITICLGWTSFC